MSITELSAAELYRRCDPDTLSFRTTLELEPAADIIGQQRATDALRFGVGIRREGYNLFVLGPNGIGKHTLVERYLKQQAAADPQPVDWCYLYNFSAPHQPMALSLPAGTAIRLRQDMERLVGDLRTAITLAFETEEYHARIHGVEERYKQRREQAFHALADEAATKDIALLKTAEGFAFTPLQDSKVVEPDEFEALPEQRRDEISAQIKALQEQLQSVIHQIPQWQREMREGIRTINDDVGLFAVKHLIDELRHRYRDQDKLQVYFNALQDDVIDHLNEFLIPDEGAPSLQGDAAAEAAFRRYRVNVLVSHHEQNGAPVCYEDSPLHQNLVGSVEYLSQLGALVTDFLLIKAGALHKANGGYLVLDAHKVLTMPYAWEALKRALRSRTLTIESLGKIYGLMATQSLEPEPIPLDIKVVLLGDRMLYYLLLSYDPEFRELFKVAADFEDHLEFSSANALLYARMMAAMIRGEGLLPFSAGAVARIIEHSMRLAGDRDRLTAHRLSMADLLREADFWARERKASQAEAPDVQQAIDMQVQRQDRMRRNLHQAIQRDQILIRTDGMQPGTVNGLFVVDLDEFSFALPARVTATARLGEGEIVDIEREVELGGALHSKGVLILASFIGSRYAYARPLSLTGNIVFEQSYGIVEGDSASLAECCALLSAICGIPVRQSLAITGSMNQHGEVQPIGGVNEKIEGYFDVCITRGLTGQQGVIIPRSNMLNLMLRSDVVAAVAAGRFHIYAISSVDEALEMLTGISAGSIDESGNYPEGSVNRAVADRLQYLADLRHEYTAPPRGHGDDEVA